MTAAAPGPDTATASPPAGAELLARVDLAAIDAALSRLPTSALLTELESVVEAIDNADPVRRKRRAGWLGRLLGRDLVAAAQPAPADVRVRLHLDAAQTQAEALEQQTAELEPFASQLRGHRDELHALVAHLSRDGAIADPVVRRLRHLSAVISTWDTALAQIDLAREHSAHLLAHHAQVRDLLVPAWRQRSTLAAHGDADALARLRDGLRAQFALMRETPHPGSTSATDTGPVNKESSP